MSNFNEDAGDMAARLYKSYGEDILDVAIKHGIVGEYLHKLNRIVHKIEMYPDRQDLAFQVYLRLKGGITIETIDKLAKVYYDVS